MADKKTVIITGVGPGIGSAAVRRFAREGWRVIALARSSGITESLASEWPDVYAVPCDVADESRVNAVVADVVQTHGRPHALIHNAVGGGWGSFREIDPRMLETNFRINVMGLLYLSRAVAPHMIAGKEGAILVTGNTSSLRGKANFAGFAPTKAAQRILAESMARDLGPHGIHVAYLLIDAVIDVPRMRSRFTNEKDNFFIKPSAIADELFHLCNQDCSAWSFLTELRPYAEVW